MNKLFFIFMYASLTVFLISCGSDDKDDKQHINPHVTTFNHTTGQGNICGQIYAINTYLGRTYYMNADDGRAYQLVPANINVEQNLVSFVPMNPYGSSGTRRACAHVTRNGNGAVQNNPYNNPYHNPYNYPYNYNNRHSSILQVHSINL